MVFFLFFILNIKEHFREITKMMWVSEGACYLCGVSFILKSTAPPGLCIFLKDICTLGGVLFFNHNKNEKRKADISVFFSFPALFLSYL